MTSKKTRSLLKQLADAQRTKHQYISVAIEPNNICVWYAKLQGLAGENDEFCGGVYLLKISIPDNFPCAAPKFHFLTPNDIFAVGDGSICISIGHNHPEAARLTLGIVGFLENIASAMLDWKTLGEGEGIIKAHSVETIKLAAASSVEYNEKNYSDILSLFAG